MKLAKNFKFCVYQTRSIAIFFILANHQTTHTTLRRHLPRWWQISLFRFTHANLKSTSSTTPARVPLGVTFVGLLLSSPRRLQCRHAVHGPSGVVLACSLPSSYNASTAPLGVAFVTLLLHESTSSTTRAWSLGSCAAVVVRRFTHANLKSGTIPSSPGSNLFCVML